MRHIKCCVVGLLAWMLYGCAAPPKVSTGAFRDTQSIEARLTRGMSTAADVKLLLGEPNGRGEMFLTVLDGPRQIWYYEDIEVTGLAQSRGLVGVKPGEATTMQLDVRQQILLVFFNRDRYDGMMWSSNASNATVWIR